MQLKYKTERYKKVTNKSENENKAEEELVGYLYNIDYGSKHEFYNN